MQEIHAGGKPLKKAYVAIFLWFTGRAIQAAAKVDKEVKKEFDTLPDEFTFALGSLPNGPWMVVGKEKGKVKYFGGNLKCRPIHLRLVIKNIEAAFLILSFQESTALATTRNRLMTDGEVPYALSVIRILDIVEVYLLPKLIASLAVKRYPSWWPFGHKLAGRIGVYTRTLLGI
ncbi:MAG: hypothetical protein CVU55_02685 [Deltaproteobacteria bacterium HGW-Deltaproteobacteria-13]|jgi:hypothetical protein|nr:MAG: hypothetical protein CVU55_02685 [Deltaproteobacteria bacterium HGW-Deltaproteobacteria-13]